MAGPEEMEEAALRGKLGHDYPLTSKIVRIFTSSTFTDTKVERNALMSRVYPGLKTFCQEQGYEFQVVDMRWGVRDEATDDHMTSELCMKEIKECQRLSTGPNFVTFLAQKYGYRPFPPKILADEFEAILSQVTDEKEKELLTSWFKRDDNSTPPLYLLQPIRQKLPHYADDTDPDERKRDRNAWWLAFERMQVALCEGAEKAFPDQEEMQLKYKWAVTEEEIHNGILKAKDPAETCYWFKRTISDISKFIREKMTARFMDAIMGAPDKEALGLLDRLKNDYVAGVLPKENITEYAVKWTQSGIDPDISKEHKTYIDKFCKDFDNTLRRMITAGIEKRLENEVKDDLVIECTNHIDFAKSKLDAFSGREEFLDIIKGRLDAAKQEHSGLYLVLCGEPGAGKTSLMAKLSQQIPIWRNTRDAPVLLRFLGTTSASASTRDMLQSLCSQLNKLTSEQKEDPPTDFKSLAERFKRDITKFSGPLVIILDSLDQLRDKGGKLREWLPTEVPENVTLLLSAIPTEEFIVVPELRKYLRKSVFLDVPTFSSSDISSVLDCWLKKAGRTLTSDQKQLVEDTCQSCPLPLFAKLTVDESLRWKSYTPADELLLGKTVIESINFLFERVEKYHGVKLVRRALGYVTIAKSGLSLNEIEDVLSLAEFALNDVYQYHQPPLRRLPPLLWVRIQEDLRDYLTNSGADGITVIRWYHRQFNTVATERYLSDAKIKNELHQCLVEYFEGKWSGDVKKDFVDKKGNKGKACRFVAAQPFVFKDASDKSSSKFNLRALNELPYHLTVTGQTEKLLEKALLNFEFIYYKLRGTSFDSLLDDYQFAIESGLNHPDINAMISFLRLSKDVLTIEAEQLPTQITGRLTKMNTAGSPGLTNLIEAASSCFFNCLISTQPHFRGGGGSFTGKLVGHTGKVQCFSFNKDNTVCISCAEDAMLKLWSMSTGDEIKSIDLSADRPHYTPWQCEAIGFCNDEKWAYIASSQYINVWDLEMEQNVNRIDLKESPMHGTKPYLLPDTISIVLIVEKLEVWDLKTAKMKESRSITPEDGSVPKPDDFSFFMSFSQLKGVRDTVVFHQQNTYGVDIFDMSKLSAPNQNHKLVAKKRKNATSIFISTCPSGKLAYLILEHNTVNAPLIGTFGLLDLSKMKTIFQKDNIEYGYYIGTYIFCAYLENDFILTTHPPGNVVINLWRSGSEDLLPLEKLAAAHITHVKETTTGLALTVLTDDTIMEFMDFNNMVSAAERAAKDDELKPGAFQVLQAVEGSKRFYHFLTAEYRLGIWDAAERKTVRWIIAPFHFPYASCITPTKVIYADYVSKTMCTCDLITGTIEDCGFPTVHVEGGQNRVHYLGNDSVLYNGPNENQLSVTKISTGKEVWSLSIEKGSKFSGLVLSEDGRVGIAEIPKTVEEMTEDIRANKVADAKLYCFDIKQRKRLPDLIAKNASQMSNSLISQRGSVLTPDGKYFVCSVTTLDDNSGVVIWDTATGKRRKLPKDEYKYVTGTMAYLKSLKCLVGTYKRDEDPHQIILWDLVKLTKIRSIQAPDAYFLWPSLDGNLTAYIDLSKKITMTVVDLKTGKSVAQFRAETEIVHCHFTPNEDFLLVSCRNKDSVIQLFMHDAEQKSKMSAKMAAQNNPVISMEQVKLDAMRKEKVLFDAPKKMDLTDAPKKQLGEGDKQKDKPVAKEKSGAKKAAAEAGGKTPSTNTKPGQASTKGKSTAKAPEKKPTAGKSK